MKLDLSKFKKIQADSRCTTLKSVDGHEIRIAHSGLSDKMRKDLDTLPLYAAQGAAVAAPLDDESPASADDNTMPVDGSGGLGGPDTEPAQPTPAPEPLPEPEPAPEPAAAAAEKDTADETERPASKNLPPKPAHMPNAGDVTVTGQRPVPTPQQYNAEDSMFGQDLALGKIKPETYQSLFAKKDTLGKLGTLFGLLVAGAGSGLTGQPNAVLHMMDRTLDRDLDAQKSSNVNAQHWYQLSLQHEVQQMATIPQAQATVAAQYGSAYQSAIQGAMTEAMLKQRGGVDLSAAEAAKNRMMLAFTQNAQTQINKLPQGQARQAAQSVLQTQVIPAMTSQINANNTKRAARGAAAAAQNPAPAQNPQAPQDTGPGHAINYDLLNKMANDASLNDKLGMAPAPGQATTADIAKIQTETTDLEDNRVAARAYDHAFKKLWSYPTKGSINPELYKAEINTLSAQIARETAGRFNLTEANQQVGGMFPNYKDYISGAGQEKYENTMNYFRGREAGTSTLNRFPKLKTPFPTFDSPFGKKQEPMVKIQPPDGSRPRMVPKSSQDKYIKKGGKVVP